MPITLIKANPDFAKSKDQDIPYLDIAELFGKTIQGESVTAGVPSVFLRVQYCTLDCQYCDTAAVWRQGNPYCFSEIFKLLEQNGIIEDFKRGHHLILTGGSPLRVQETLTKMLIAFREKYDFIPFIEVENECMIYPTNDFANFVSQWNNSPKLANSGMKEKIRYKKDLIQYMSGFDNTWFKFVVDCEEDWEEIREFFLEPQLIKREQILIMPKGETQEELNETRGIAVEMAIKHNVRFTDRLHITIWNKKTGV
jgi:7-carboxy-7-deazaguanine synthase